MTITYDEDKDCYSIKEVAEILGCTIQMVYMLVWTNKLAASKIRVTDTAKVERWQIPRTVLVEHIQAIRTNKDKFKDMLSAKEAASFSGISWIHLNKLLRSGKLVAEKEVHGRRQDWKIRKEVLIDFMEFRKSKEYRKKKSTIN